jgi:hypothetical protein
LCRTLSIEKQCYRTVDDFAMQLRLAVEPHRYAVGERFDALQFDGVWRGQPTYHQTDH